MIMAMRLCFERGIFPVHRWTQLLRSSVLRGNLRGFRPQRYKFLKNEQVLSCLTSEQHTNCAQLRGDKLTTRQYLRSFAMTAAYAWPAQSQRTSVLWQLRLHIRLKSSLFSGRQTCTLRTLFSSVMSLSGH